MILAVDVSNTCTTLGCVERRSGEIRFTAQLASDRRRTADEYAILLHNLFVLHQTDPHEMEGCILSSVVPSLTPLVRQALERITGKKVMVVGAGVKTGLNILIDNPAQLGSDMVAMAVAALALYPKPVLIFDLSTATTLSVLDAKGGYLGGMIMPGPSLGMEALSQSAAQLPHISFEPPRRLIATNTVECMKSGYIYGTAAMLDGVIARIEEKLGEKASVVATGSQASDIVRFCKRKMVFEPNLRLIGLRLIYNRNTEAENRDKNKIERA